MRSGGLSFSYGREKVFSGIDLNAGYGEIIGIIGRNGAGKSTLSRCLCGLIKESGGEILLDGVRLKDRTRRRQSFLVMQDVNHQLFSDSVANECHMSSEDVSDEKADKALSLLDLSDFKDKHPMALSGGQKQRLAVATAILSGKKILIFDEPSSGLDYRRMESVSEMIRKTASDDRIVIVVSHDYELLNNICDRCFCVTGEKDN
ncbi:ATP-binding cassette domain-containing protein [Ruminococcus sp.]|uniref:ATP-binding cassette domain-containing protein n=1 Tax=Ruminococcus sp. TaxID=41978 RepID=UPI002D1FBDC7|nr:ATP-binding cassette domain-containing protein [Ruminococcus sp.]